MRLRVLISSSIDEASPLARGTDGRAALDGRMRAAAASRNRLDDRQYLSRGAGGQRAGRGVRPWVHPVMSPNRLGGRAHEVHDAEAKAETSTAAAFGRLFALRSERRLPISRGSAAVLTDKCAGFVFVRRGCRPPRTSALNEDETCAFVDRKSTRLNSSH